MFGCSGHTLIWCECTYYILYSEFFCWRNPQPWDSTEIWEAELTDSGDGIKDGSLKCVVKVENVSVMMPRWTPQNELLYIGDQSDWWNVYHVTADGDHLNLCLREEELGGPHWQFGNSMYSVNPSGTGKIATSFAGVCLHGSK